MIRHQWRHLIPLIGIWNLEKFQTVLTIHFTADWIAVYIFRFSFCNENAFPTAAHGQARVACKILIFYYVTWRTHSLSISLLSKLSTHRQITVKDQIVCNFYYQVLKICLVIRRFRNYCSAAFLYLGGSTLIHLTPSPQKGENEK